MATNFDTIRNEGRLLYEYIRGSHLYGLNTKDSDLDTSAIYMANPNEILGFIGYKPQISDAKHDNNWFEIGEFARLILKSNPTILEALFIPSDKILGEINPLFIPFLENRNEFISKECFNPFFGYAKSQIEKARGLNKKIVNPVTEHLTPLDFVYTFKNQGSTKITNWLNERGLFQRFCGLVNIPNMHNVYGLYYDFGQHCERIESWADDKRFIAFASLYFATKDDSETISILIKQRNNKYRGIVGDSDDIFIEKIEGAPKIFDLRLSSIDDKNTKPITHICYNSSGYTKHCNDFKDYKTWVKERNPKRYESNLDKNYDSKNMMHCFRMIHMAKEIANGDGIILDRNIGGDRDFLMKVRNHGFEYDEIITMLDKETEEMNQMMATSTINKTINRELLNELLIDFRKKTIL